LTQFDPFGNNGECAIHGFQDEVKMGRRSKVLECWSQRPGSRTAKNVQALLSWKSFLIFFSIKRWG